jgi:hypothetical protein
MVVLTSGLIPRKNSFAVMMVQMDFEQSGRDRLTLREIVYGALVPSVLGGSQHHSRTYRLPVQVFRDGKELPIQNLPE